MVRVRVTDNVEFKSKFKIWAWVTLWLTIVVAHILSVKFPIC